MPRVKSLSTIRAQIRALEKRAETIEAKSEQKIVDLVALINRHGLTIADWKNAVAMSKGRKRGGGLGKRVPVKYADDKGNKWTGRGRPPLWLVAAEKTGKKRESFLVKAAK